MIRSLDLTSKEKQWVVLRRPPLLAEKLNFSKRPRRQKERGLYTVLQVTVGALNGATVIYKTIGTLVIGMTKLTGSHLKVRIPKPCKKGHLCFEIGYSVFIPLWDARMPQVDWVLRREKRAPNSSRITKFEALFSDIDTSCVDLWSTCETQSQQLLGLKFMLPRNI